MPATPAANRRLTTILITLVIALSVTLLALLYTIAQSPHQRIEPVANLTPMSQRTDAVTRASDAVAYISTGGVRCSGVLIDPTWVVTVRHCVNTDATTGHSSSVQVRLGVDQTVVNVDHIRTGQAVLYRHSDLALVRLDAPITNVTPASLASDPLPASLIGLGFGPDPTRASEIMLGDLYPQGDHEASHHCLIVGQRSVVPGDSGGAVLTGDGELFGLLSYNLGLAPPGHESPTEFYAGIIASTDAERDWIRDVVVGQHLDDRTALTPIPGTTT